MREGRVSYDSSSRSEDPSSCDQILPRGVRHKGPARREAPPKEPSKATWTTRQEAAQLLTPDQTSALPVPDPAHAPPPAPVPLPGDPWALMDAVHQLGLG